MLPSERLGSNDSWWDVHAGLQAVTRQRTPAIGGDRPQPPRLEKKLASLTNGAEEVRVGILSGSKSTAGM